MFGSPRPSGRGSWGGGTRILLTVKVRSAHGSPSSSASPSTHGSPLGAQAKPATFQGKEVLKSWSREAQGPLGQPKST